MWYQIRGQNDFFVVVHYSLCFALFYFIVFVQIIPEVTGDKGGLEFDANKSSSNTVYVGKWLKIKGDKLEM